MSDPEYLNRTVWARIAPSPIHGVGIFAIRDIPSGQPITDYSYNHVKGHWNPSYENPVRFFEVPPEEFDRILPAIRSLILDRMLYDETNKIFRFVSPNHDAFLQAFMNHSDDPNSFNCVALRHISKGEEITEDFRQLFDTPHPLTKWHHRFLYGSNRDTEGGKAA